MNEYIDIYCERLEPGLWSEPLNAISNVAFFIAAFLAFNLTREPSRFDWRAAVLILFLAVIGTGSTLFHTFATRWAMLSDVLPILFYQIAFIVFYTNRVIGLNALKTTAVLGGFFVTIYAIGLLPEEWLNGSLSYAPALLFLIGLGVWHLKNAKIERWGLLAAAAIFVLSLGLRSIDMAVCKTLPYGTHFFWHIFNGCVLYLTTRAYILSTHKP